MEEIYSATVQALLHNWKYHRCSSHLIGFFLQFLIPLKRGHGYKKLSVRLLCESLEGTSCNEYTYRVFIKVVVVDLFLFHFVIDPNEGGGWGGSTLSSGDWLPFLAEAT